MDFLTVDEKNDYRRLKDVFDICKEAEDRGTCLEIEELFECASHLKKRLCRYVGERLFEAWLDEEESEDA
jgi:hypothetical protein